MPGILIVGNDGVEKRKLSNCLKKSDIPRQRLLPYDLTVATALRLPLPTIAKKAQAVLADVVVFVLDLSQLRSIQVVQESLQSLPVSFFLGKVCFVVTNACQYEEQSTLLDGAFELAHQFNSPLITVDLTSELSLKAVERQLIKLVEINCAMHSSVSPLLLTRTQPTPQELD